MKNILSFLGFFIVVVFVLLGVYVYSVSIGLPNVRALENWHPPEASMVYDSNGKLIGTIGAQNRIYVTIDKIPKIVQDAFISAEDKTFYHNIGIDPLSIIRALIVDLEKGKAVEGGSTITQQLAKNLFLTPKKTISRKIKEAILAIEITHTFPKSKILEMYLNQIYLGHGAFGVEAASETYFGKHVWQLNLDEAALLAGLPRAPTRYDPYINPNLALQRRNYVLYRMYKDGYITKEEYLKASQKPIVLNKHTNPITNSDYFVSFVKDYMYRNFPDLIYQGGLKIYTTLNEKLQQAAENAVRNQILYISKLEHYPVLPWSITDTIAKFKAQKIDLKKSRYYIGFVKSVKNNQANIDINGTEVTAKIFPGIDAGEYVMVELSRRNNEFSAKIIPQLQSALVSMNVHNGAILAMVGGYSYQLSSYNRAVYALRQTGSAIKPIVYLAALMKGYTQITEIDATPHAYPDPSAPGGFWTPRNYEGESFTTITLRKALAYSVNTASVNLLAQVGFDLPISLAARVGIKLPPYYSMVLGSTSVTPLQLTNMFQAFANLGTYCQPYFITKIVNSQNQVVYTGHPVCYNVFPATYDRVLISMLEYVVKVGTGYAAHVLGPYIAGKTGTTNHYDDAWFEGFSSDVVTGVWTGFDIRKRIGHNMAGAVASLPTWINYMKEALKIYPEKPFPLPDGVEYVEIDPKTHLRATPSCPGEPILFVKGTAPKTTCQNVSLPVLQSLNPNQPQNPGSPLQPLNNNSSQSQQQSSQGAISPAKPSTNPSSKNPNSILPKIIQQINKETRKIDNETKNIDKELNNAR
ncbi:MAG: PBP1A family penicillin-binding protein [Hydrogenobaculum sp.]